MTGAEERNTPQHALSEVKKRVREEGCQFSNRVRNRQLGRFDCDEEDVRECLLSLTGDDFYKSQFREHGQYDVWLDVYTPYWDGIDWYVKFFVGKNDRVVVWSFKWSGTI